jgi:cytidylate kinase
VIRVCIAGVTGWTGRAVADAIEGADDLQLVAGVSRSDPGSFSSVTEALDAVEADVLVDYTHAAVVTQNVVAAVERAVAVVVFYDRFDAVVLLSSPADVLLERIASRTTNDYGKAPEERGMILQHIAEVEPLLRAGCTHEIDAARPLAAVVELLVAIGSR